MLIFFSDVIRVLYFSSFLSCEWNLRIIVIFLSMNYSKYKWYSVHWERLGIVIMKRFYFLRTSKHPSKSWKNFHSNISGYKKYVYNTNPTLRIVISAFGNSYDLSRIESCPMVIDTNSTFSSLKHLNFYKSYCIFNVTCFRLSKSATKIDQMRTPPAWTIRKQCTHSHSAYRVARLYF